MLIQSRQRFDTVAEFDPRTGAIRPRLRPAGMELSGTDGWFEMLGDSCVVFYREDGRLWLRVDDWLVDLDGAATVDWRREGDVAVFTVADPAGEVVLRYPYRPPIPDDPTPFVEVEDWDLGLFVANVMGDEERSDLVRRGLRSGDEQTSPVKRDMTHL